MTFRGAYRFASAAELDAAIVAIEELIDAEPDDLVPALALHRRGVELRVTVDTVCARDSYLAYETLIETLATFASSGEVVGEIDDTLTTYAAVCEPPALVRGVASAFVWLPLVASDPLVEMVLA